MAFSLDRHEPDTFLFVFRHYPGWDFMAALGHPVTLVGVYLHHVPAEIHVVLDAPYSSETFCAMALFRIPNFDLDAFRRANSTLPRFRRGPNPHRPANGEAILRSAHRVTTGLLKAFVIAPVFLASSKLGDFNPGEASILFVGE